MMLISPVTAEAEVAKLVKAFDEVTAQLVSAPFSRTGEGPGMRA